jgi:hypothetical protein
VAIGGGGLATTGTTAVDTAEDGGFGFRIRLLLFLLTSIPPPGTRAVGTVPTAPFRRALWRKKNHSMKKQFKPVAPPTKLEKNFFFKKASDSSPVLARWSRSVF